MVGINKIKLLIGIFIPIFAFFLMSQNTYAAPLQTQIFNEFITDSNYQNQRIDGLGFGRQYRRSLTGIYWYEFVTPQMTPQGNFATIHFETNLVFETTSRENANFVNTVLNGADNLTPAVTNVWSGSTPVAIESQTTTYAVTQWQQTISGITYYENTLTIYGDIVLSNVPSNAATYYFHIASSRGTSYTFLSLYTADVAMYFEQNPASIIYTSNVNDALLQTQIAQNEVVIQNQTTIIDQNQTVIDQNNQAYDNISGQSSSDIDGATNQQTTSLISVISGFIGAFSGINATNCNLTLDFPEYAGGGRTVDICSGKEKAPRIIEIGSSLLLISVFVPLAYVLIRMIYNEIRSWTNG